jgi:hypothetical protein
MKKFIAVISFVAYFVAGFGIWVNSHYCMKKLVSVHLFETEAEVCGLCGMDTHESNGCCRDEVTVIKLVQDQNKIPVLKFELPALEAQITLPSEFILSPYYNAVVSKHYYNHSPPLLSAQDTYLQNNVFRI